MDALTHVPLDSHAQLRAHKPSFSSRCMTLCTGAVICAMRACGRHAARTCYAHGASCNALCAFSGLHLPQFRSEMCARSPPCDARENRPSFALTLGRRWRAAAFHICTGTGLTPPTSGLGLGSPLPYLHRDCAHAATSAPGLRSALPHLHRDWAIKPGRRRHASVGAAPIAWQHSHGHPELHARRACVQVARPTPAVAGTHVCVLASTRRPPCLRARTPSAALRWFVGSAAHP